MDRREHWGEPHSALAWRALLAIVIPVGLLFVAFLIPALIPNGVARLPAHRQVAGRHALQAAAMGCLDNPIQRLFIPKQRLYWLDPTWQPGSEGSSEWRGRVVARVRGHTLFGLPADETTIYAGGSVCHRVDGGPQQALHEAIEQAAGHGNARWLIRLPDDAFPPTGVVGRIDFGQGRSVVDRPPPPELADLPYYDAAAIFAATVEAAPSWAFLGEGDEGARYGLRDVAMAVAGADGPLVVVGVTVKAGSLSRIEYALVSAPTLRPAVLWLFGYGHAEPLDQPAALPS